MKIKKDGHLVEPLDPDVDAKSQKTPKKKQTGSKQPSRKRPRSESDPKDGNKRNLPLAMETSRKGKGKVIESSHCPDLDTNVDIPAEDRRSLKIRMSARPGGGGGRPGADNRRPSAWPLVGRQAPYWRPSCTRPPS
ncbi:hypothetical protein R1flu_019621 [Riccia fluitans]|uniref:Uncharacterized protein n=1 Tax=Riccia fluitans TaxID=41844 RepID=A0ABD1ZJ63_9MARC